MSEPGSLSVPVALVQRIAKPVLWVLVPIFLYSALVLGAWNGFASDFDATRGEAIRYHLANAHAVGHMSDRGRFLSCQDNRIELTDDAKAVCARGVESSSRQRIPGNEHSADFLELFSCSNTAPEEMRKPNRRRQLFSEWVNFETLREVMKSIVLPSGALSEAARA